MLVRIGRLGSGRQGEAPHVLPQYFLLASNKSCAWNEFAGSIYIVFIKKLEVMFTYMIIE